MTIGFRRDQANDSRMAVWEACEVDYFPTDANVVQSSMLERFAIKIVHCLAIADDFWYN